MGLNDSIKARDLLFNEVAAYLYQLDFNKEQFIKILEMGDVDVQNAITTWQLKQKSNGPKTPGIR